MRICSTCTAGTTHAGWTTMIDRTGVATGSCSSGGAIAVVWRERIINLKLELHGSSKRYQPVTAAQASAPAIADACIVREAIFLIDNRPLLLLLLFLLLLSLLELCDKFYHKGPARHIAGHRSHHRRCTSPSTLRLSQHGHQERDGHAEWDQVD